MAECTKLQDCSRCPASDEFKLRVYVDLKAASVVVTAANIDAITRDPRKARAKLAKEAKIIDAMIRSGTTDNDHSMRRPRRAARESSKSNSNTIPAR